MSSLPADDDDIDYAAAAKQWAWRKRTPEKIDRQAIQDFSKALNRPIDTLKVTECDPFYIGETQRAEAEWFL
jgi:hypothetical protein